jgi:hypothetical protein
MNSAMFTPFEVLRLWVKQAPLRQRVSALGGGVLALALLAWLLVPTTVRVPTTRLSAAGSGSNPNAPASAGNNAAATTAVPPATATGTEGIGGAGGPAPGGAGGGTAGPSHCVSPPGTDQGVGPTQIKIGVAIIELAGSAANSTFGLPSAQDQQTYYQDVINSVNASGGAACRSLVPDFITVDETDPSQQQAACQQFAQDGVFFLIDVGAFFTPPSAKDCLAQEHIPFLSTALLTQSEVQQFYPYLWSLFGIYDTLYRTAAVALHDLGFFGPHYGFSKLGILYRDCSPEIYTEFVADLHQIGLSSSQIDSYDLGCPSNFASPSALQQAVLQFEQDRVSSVTEIMDVEDFANFTKIAQEQGFDPHYGLADDGVVPTTGAALTPDPNNIDNALAITPSRYGEQNSGLAPTAGTVACNTLFARDGEPPVYQQPDGIGGDACSELWILVDAIDHAPTLTRAALVQGLEAIGTSLDLSYPEAPADFSGAGTVSGGQYWRPVSFTTACDCWKVLDPTFQPDF